MVFCGKCGTKNPDDNLYCRQCGARISQSIPTESEPVPEPEPKRTEKPVEVNYIIESGGMQVRDAKKGRARQKEQKKTGKWQNFFVFPIAIFREM